MSERERQAPQRPLWKPAARAFSKQVVIHNISVGFTVTVKRVIAARKRSRGANEPLPGQPPAALQDSADG